MTPEKRTEKIVSMLVTNNEINEAVAKKLGWVQCCNPKTMENEKIIDCFGWSKGGSHFHEIYPNYCTDIKAAWEITPHVDFNKFKHWPLPMELCLEFLNEKH